MKVLYVMGYGRSGSTLLDQILGNYDGVTGCGELSQIAKNGWINNEYCSCGERVNTCAFWSAVYCLWSERKLSRGVDEFYALIDRYETHTSFWKSVTHHASAGRDFDCYLHDLALLYKCVREVSGDDIVVDSSKNVARAYNLSLLTDISVKYLHLVRDCRGVVNSLEKSWQKDEEGGVQESLDARNWVRTAMVWSLYNYECEILKKRHLADSLLVRYEDLAERPRGELTKIEALLNIPSFSTKALTYLEKGQNQLHTVAGNRLRMQKGIVVRFDDKWCESLPLWKRCAITIVTPHLMSKYLYI